MGSRGSQDREVPQPVTRSGANRREQEPGSFAGASGPAGGKPHGEPHTECVVDANRLNEARWAACNWTQWFDGRAPTMEQAAKVADEVVRSYLGLSPEDWQEATR